MRHGDGRKPVIKRLEIEEPDGGIAEAGQNDPIGGIDTGGGRQLIVKQIGARMQCQIANLGVAGFPELDARFGVHERVVCDQIADKAGWAAKISIRLIELVGELIRWIIPVAMSDRLIDIQIPPPVVRDAKSVTNFLVWS